MYGGGGVIAKNITIRDNYIAHTFGELESVDTWYTWQKNTMDVGIYTDDRSQNILVEGNTIINTNTGVFMHNNQSVTLKNNIIFQPRETGVDIRNDWIINDWAFMKDNHLEGNIVYVDAEDAHPLQIFDEKDNWKRFATYDNNTLVNTAGQKEVILKKWVDNDYSTYKGKDQAFTIEEWRAIQASSGSSERSRGTPSFLKPPNDFQALIISNPSDTLLKKDLRGKKGYTYYDLEGEVTEALSIEPWQSKIVFFTIKD